MRWHGPRVTLWLLAMMSFFVSSQALAEPIRLSELLELVVDNPAIVARDAAVQVAIAGSRVVESERSPTLTADALTPIVGDRSASEPEYSMRAEQPLYDWGLNRSRVEGSRAEVEAARLGRDQTLMDLSVGLSEAFHRLAVGRLQLQILDDARGSLDELDQMMRRRVEQQVSPRVDLEIIESQIALREVQAETVRRDISRQQLAILRTAKTLVENTDIDECSLTLEVDEPRWVSRAIDASPGLSKFAAMISGHVAEQAAIRSEGYPTIVGGYQFDTDIDGDNFDQRGYVALRFELQLGSQLEARAAVERARELEQKSLRVEMTEAIAQQTSELISEYEMSRRMSSIQRKLADSRATQRASYLRRFVAGRASWTDVLTADRELAEARIAEASAKVGACKALSLLSITTGSSDPYAVD